jgi:hypothetical protein
MNTLKHRTLAAVGAAAVLVAGANVAAYAANGHPLLIGSRNTETQQTVLKNNGTGPALRLVTEPTGAPPLSVNSGVKVAKLNVDRLDGYSAQDFESFSQRFTIPEDTTTGSLALDLPELEPGYYDVSFWVMAQMSSVGQIITCYVAVGNGPYSLLSYGVHSGIYSTSTGSGSFGVPPGETARFRCYSSSGTATFDPGGNAAHRSHIVFTRVDSLDEDPGTPPADLKARPGGAAGAAGETR